MFEASIIFAVYKRASVQCSGKWSSYYYLHSFRGIKHPILDLLPTQVFFYPLLLAKFEMNLLKELKSLKHLIAKKDYITRKRKKKTESSENNCKKKIEGKKQAANEKAKSCIKVMWQPTDRDGVKEDRQNRVLSSKTSHGVGISLFIAHRSTILSYAFWNNDFLQSNETLIMMWLKSISMLFLVQTMLKTIFLPFLFVTSFDA